MIWKIPTIEEIYNYYHRETFYAMKKVYPKAIKNFDSLYENKERVEYLKRFQLMLERNRDSVDWKLYIKALAQVFEKRFDIKLLGSFAGNKIYRDYVKCLYLDDNDEESMYKKIVQSIQFLSEYLKANNFKFADYFKENKDTNPLALQHIYAGTVSVYFYACLDKDKLNGLFDYPDDLFLELFKLTKQEFLETYILSKRSYLLTYTKILKLIEKMEKIF